MHVVVIACTMMLIVGEIRLSQDLCPTSSPGFGCLAGQVTFVQVPYKEFDYTGTPQPFAVVSRAPKY